MTIAARCDLCAWITGFCNGSCNQLDYKTELAKAKAENERLTRERDEALDRIENASIAASGTQPTHHHRCIAIMSALGFDYGDPDWMMPDEKRRLRDAEDELAAAKAENERLRKVMHDIKHWASTRCPCNEDSPDPCPLCGATVERGTCKAVESIFPCDLLRSIREALKEQPR